MKWKKTPIMVIDPHPVVHAGLKMILAYETDMEIVMTATSVDEAMELLTENLPVVVLVDPSLRDCEGTCFIQRLRAEFPELGILAYTRSEQTLYEDRLAIAMADGYLVKTASPTVLKETMRSLLAEKSSFAEEQLDCARENSRVTGKGPHKLINKLSKRELDVFNLIGLGLDAAQMSQELKISRNTVDTHRINIKNKLGLPNGKALDRFAYESTRRRIFGKHL